MTRVAFDGDECMEQSLLCQLENSGITIVEVA